MALHELLADDEKWEREASHRDLSILVSPNGASASMQVTSLLACLVNKETATFGSTRKYLSTTCKLKLRLLWASKITQSWQTAAVAAF